MNPPHAVENLLRTLPAAATATFLALFPIVNPFGGIPLFFSLTSGFTPLERNRTALRTAFYVFAILVTFMFFGRFVLNFFGISLPVLKIAGGLIVANTAWGMVTGGHRLTAAESDEATTKEDISLTPMAMPMLSGPGSIGVVMGLAAHVDSPTAYVGHGDRHRWTGDFGLSVPALGRSASRAARAERRGSDQPHFRISDSRDRGAVDLGWSGGVQ